MNGVRHAYPSRWVNNIQVNLIENIKIHNIIIQRHVMYLLSFAVENPRLLIGLADLLKNCGLA
jgi:hypothetical protein